jgi:ketosteroid isomerase-like protein
MSVINESPEVALIGRLWAAISSGDLSVLEQELAPDARWRAVSDGPWNCEGREAIVETMRRNLAGRVRGTIEETIQDGPRVLVAFRPEAPLPNSERPLDDGIAYMVVTIRDGKVLELKGCANRAAAKAYLEGKEIPAAPVLEGPGRPAVVPQASEHRVSGLIPFVHVEDVQRSIDFYHHLGFRPARECCSTCTRPIWPRCASSCSGPASTLGRSRTAHPVRVSRCSSPTPMVMS